MPTLTIMTGDQAGTNFELANRTLSVGRDPSRDIQVTDPKVSRKHATIRLDGATYIIAATKAMNGILVNGDLIEGEAGLREGDEITLGTTILKFGQPDRSNFTDAVHTRKVADSDARDANTML